MNAMRYIDADFTARSCVLHVVPPSRDAARDDLVVDRAVTERWRELGDEERARVSAFLSGVEMEGIVHDARHDARLPDGLASDLACGAPALRAAFPGLLRRVVGLERAGNVLVARVSCAGEHSRAFFRILSPTLRPVTFDVVHSLVVFEGRVLGHRVAIDVRAILLQLVGRVATHP